MWMISLPAWGDHYVEMLLRYTLPSLHACQPPKEKMFIVVHTDQPDRVQPALEGFAHDIRPVPLCEDGRRSYLSMSRAHAEVIALAPVGSIVTLMCADVIFSTECFTAAEQRFAEGKKAVCCAGSRTVGPLFGNAPPIGVKARDLLAWSMIHRHPIIVQCFWPYGHSPIPSQIYFEDKEGITARVFTPCLFAMVKDRELAFTGTIDRDLLEVFDRSEIHVVTSRDEMAVVEISPIYKTFGVTDERMTPASVASWAKGYPLSDLNYWFFSHRLEITGPGGDIDQRAHDAIMQEVAVC